MYYPGQSVICLSKTPRLFARMLTSFWPPLTRHYSEGILINNGGQDASNELASIYGWSSIVPGENLSFARGNNLAAKASQYSHLVLVNDDAILDRGILQVLWDYRNYPIVGSVIRNNSGAITHHGGTFTSDLSPIHHTPEKPENVECSAPWVTFACVQIKHEIWDALGGLDEGYWYGHEDVDFCLRLIESGRGCALVAPNANLRHDELGTRRPPGDNDGAEKFRQDWTAYRINALRERASLDVVWRN